MPEIIDDQEADLVHSRLGDLVGAHLPFSLYAFTSGSLPYGAAVRGRSDIDVNVIFPTETPCSDALLARINGFVDSLAVLHEEHGLSMDRRYPGEYFTISQAWDAAAGRGIPICDGNPTLPAHPDNDYWETSEETWYLAWLGALSFSRHVAGKLEPFCALRQQGWQTLILLCLTDLVGQPVTGRLMLDRILRPEHPSGGFGVHPGYRRFEELERSSIDQTLDCLAEQGYLHMNSNGYTVHEAAVGAWRKELAARHTQGFTAASLLTVSSSKRLAR